MDGKFVYFTADDDGRVNLFRAPAIGGEITQAISGHDVVSGYNIARSEDIAAQVACINRPAELFSLPASGEA